jgi:predicted Zn finger-like uncharacterized protein
MLIVCPNCATSYRVEPSSLGASGRSVRCVRCRSVWFAHDPSALSELAHDHRAEVMAVAAAASAPAAAQLEPPTAAMTAPTAEIFDGGDATAETPPDIGEIPQEEAPLAPTLPEHGMLPFHGRIASTDASELAPTEDGASVAMPGEDVESVAARRARRKGLRQRLRLPMPGLPATIMALIAVNTILIGWRTDVVRVAPQTASLYAAIGLPVNLRGLAFANVTTATEAHDGVTVLVVEGSIASASKHVVEVPRLRFAVRNPKGQEVYSWTALPERSVLAPGETLSFRSRLASPPPEGRDVAVRFFNRRDRIAGIQ